MSIAVLVLVLVVLSAMFAGLIAGTDPLSISPRDRYTAPGAEFLFGSDQYGRDIFARVLHGGQISLAVGVLAASLAAVIGTLAGLLAGSFRIVDAILMRVMDGLMAIPNILLAVAIVSLVGPSLLSIVVAICIPEIPRVARLIRAMVLTLREEPYVFAAISMSIPRWKVVLRHILPGCLAPLAVQFSYMFAAAILTEAVLGFLGVGFPSEIPSWGNVIADGKSAFQRAPWCILFPGLFLSVTVLAVNVLGDSLRDRLDPRLAARRRPS
ncbi:ABC transporter permease [Frigidibacter sp.]|uniref:ABC transporter permease n=1 Tax=Frigidibacter sp. TaxID=2586418 RepID=UPI002736E9F9|nr:ABC transporter permease [Frigidibacter sp.]MDP3340598.1 ABC transporter permease [Frigidibacter sp.]